MDLIDKWIIGLLSILIISLFIANVYAYEEEFEDKPYEEVKDDEWEDTFDECWNCPEKKPVVEDDDSKTKTTEKDKKDKKDCKGKECGKSNEDHGKNNEDHGKNKDKGKPPKGGKNK